MTSKEALIDLRSELQAYDLEGIPNLFENLDIIERDLEVLEILKKYYDKNSYVKTGGEWIGIVINRKDKGFKKAKEYLDR